MDRSVQPKRLFPTNLPEREWVGFPAEGFSVPVTGVIYRSAQPPSCGLPLGGIGTGCLDLESDGTFGYSSIFNSLSPRRGPLHMPFLGLAVGGETWVLTTNTSNRMRGTKCANEIHYWGHYPVVDLEYEIDAPVSVGLRAWSPFIPGDEVSSNTPGAVFEIHLRNESKSRQNGTVVFSFPGVGTYEREYYAPVRSHAGEFAVEAEGGEYTGLAIPDCAREHSRADIQSYALAVVGKNRVRMGGGLEADGSAWSRIEKELPPPPHRSDKMDSAASIAVDFGLEAGEAKVIKMVLTWYNRQWYGLGIPAYGHTVFSDSAEPCECTNKYTYKYTERFNNAMDVAEFLIRGHDSLLRRILAWQEAVYASAELPGWLQDSLINALHLITEDSVWAAPRPPIGDWAAPDGVFALNESPRDCPCMDAQCSNWYGHWPVVYFFPRLSLTTARAYKQFVRPDGQPPFVLGQWWDLVRPTNYEYQKSQNGTVFAATIDRLWQFTGNDDVLREFYDSVKRATEYIIGLEDGPYRLVSVSSVNIFEVHTWPGIITYVAGMRMAGLRIVERMAEKMGDHEFAAKCRAWIEEGTRILEELMWNGEYYLLYNSPEIGETSDSIMANQLNGDWITGIHGVAGVFNKDRVKVTLDTLKRTVVDYAACGVINLLKADGTEDTRTYRARSFFPAEAFILAMTYMYNGQLATGLDIVRKCMENLVCKQGYTWDVPNSIDVETAKVDFGTDYYQLLMLWAVPLGLQQLTISEASSPGGLVDRIIKAGAPGR